MYLKKLLELRHTLAFRLTVWYGAIFTISFLGAFVAFYLLMGAVIRGRTDQDLLNEAKEFSSLLALKGMDAVKTAMELEAESEGVGKIFFRLLTSQGEEFACSDMSSWRGAGIGRVALKRLDGGTDHVFETLAVPENSSGVRILYSLIGPGAILQIGQSLEDDKRFLEVFREIFGTTMAFVVFFAGLIGWFMATRALAGLEEVTRTAIHIAKGEFHLRVAVAGRGQEIDRLAATFNNMVERIQALIIGMREMTDNIAHDLRSPITRIRGISETTLITARSRADYEVMAGSIVEECDRLLEMINTMLEISEAEAGVTKLVMCEIDLTKLVRDACELFQPISEDKDIRVIQRLSGSTHIHGDRQKIQRVVANLLDNALKYTPTGGKVTVSVDGNEANAVFSISDTGIGISGDDLPGIFQRFYRCDRSRSHAGIGLGLSLALALVRAHGGDITVSSAPGQGSSFTVTLPRSPVSH